MPKRTSNQQRRSKIQNNNTNTLSPENTLTMEYESLNEELIAIYQSNCQKNGDGFADQILSRAARMGLLHAAMLEDDTSVSIEPSIAALLSQTVEEMTIGATANASALESRLPARPEPLLKKESNNEISCLDVDAFFEEYPECSKMLPDLNGDDESDSDDSDVVEVLPSRRPKKDLKRTNHSHSQEQASQSTNATRPLQQQHSNNTASQNRPMSNPYQKQSQPTNSNSNGVSTRPNPYGKNVQRSNTFDYTQESATSARNAANHQPRSHQQQYQQQQQQYARNTTAPATTNAAWDNYQQQQNPFQTAREFAKTNGDQKNDYHHQAGPPTNNGWNNYNHNNDPNHQYVNQHTNNIGYSPPPPEEMEPPMRGGGPIISDSLKKKFQPPKKVANDKSKPASRGACPMPKRNGGGVQMQRPSSSSSRKTDDDEEELPEELQHLDKELVKKIQNEIMESGDKITFDDIAGLEQAKQTVQEVVCWPMKRPDLFTGLRRAPNGLLLYGPPGTGKTLIGKAIAHESGATFFSISSSSLTSKWIGEGEKLVRTLFAVAAYREPAVVFIDEIDSLLTQRKASENEASRRIKTEFLVQLDGTGTTGQGRVLVIGATNRPQELDEAARRRFTKRLYIPLPEEKDRSALLQVLLNKNDHVLSIEEIQKLAQETNGFSGADLKSLCADAALGPIRKLKERALTIDKKDVPPIAYKHFRKSLKGLNPSVAPSEIIQYEDWDKLYGTKRASEEDSSSDEE